MCVCHIIHIYVRVSSVYSKGTPQWFRKAHDQILRDSPDQHLVAQERAKIEALATAIAARMRADYLARPR